MDKPREISAREIDPKDERMFIEKSALDAANLKIQQLEERVLALQMIEPKELQEANDRADRHLGERNKLQARIAELEKENDLYSDQIERFLASMKNANEKIQALEAENERLAANLTKLSIEHPCYQLSKQLESEIDRLAKLNAQYKTALEFYADGNNFDDCGTHGHWKLLGTELGATGEEFIPDKGNIAIEALKSGGES